jgi:hypothetical protein
VPVCPGVDVVQVSPMGQGQSIFGQHVSSSAEPHLPAYSTLQLLCGFVHAVPHTPAVEPCAVLHAWFMSGSQSPQCTVPPHADGRSPQL